MDSFISKKENWRVGEDNLVELVSNSHQRTLSKRYSVLIMLSVFYVTWPARMVKKLDVEMEMDWQHIRTRIIHGNQLIVIIVMERVKDEPIFEMRYLLI